MNEFIKELIMIMGSYFGVIILLFAVLTSSVVDGYLPGLSKT